MSICWLYAQIRKSTGKLELYRKFTNSLAVTVLLSVLWIGYEVVVCFFIASFLSYLPQQVKIRFWLNYRNVFFVILILCFMLITTSVSGSDLIMFQLYFNASDPLGELWRRAWAIPAFWILLAYALLIVICILWAPSRNPTRYSLSLLLLFRRSKKRKKIMVNIPKKGLGLGALNLSIEDRWKYQFVQITPLNSARVLL